MAIKRLETIALLASLVVVSPLAVNAQTDSGTASSWSATYLQCAEGCGNDFHFSEHTDPSFAPIRNACIQGCRGIDENTLPNYQQCYRGCKKLFKYLHGMRAELAKFQTTCIEGCGGRGAAVTGSPESTE